MKLIKTAIDRNSKVYVSAMYEHDPKKARRKLVRLVGACERSLTSARTAGHRLRVLSKARKFKPVW